MVEVEQGPLRALEQHTLAAVYLGVEVRRNVDEMRHDATRGLEITLDHFTGVDRRVVEQRRSQSILFR